MPLVTEKKIQKRLREVSRQMGIEEKELVDRAVFLYLESVRRVLEVGKEFDAWDSLSDEALRTLAKRLPARL